MKKTEYSFTKTVNYGFDETIERVKNELKKEGFGVLADLDFKSTLKEKLNVEFRPYRVLAACNPPNALRALKAEEQIGLFLPCNVIIYENESNDVIVAAIDPLTNMSIVKNNEVLEVAQIIQAKLKTVIEKV